MINAAELTRVRQAKYAKRKRVNQVALTLSLAAMAFGVFWLVWILWETITLGIGGLSLALFSEMTPDRKSTRLNSSHSQISYAVSLDRKSTRLNSSHSQISYAVFCLKKKNNIQH